MLHVLTTLAFFQCKEYQDKTQAIFQAETQAKILYFELGPRSLTLASRGPLASRSASTRTRSSPYGTALPRSCWGPTSTPALSTFGPSAASSQR